MKETYVSHVNMIILKCTNIHVSMCNDQWKHIRISMWIHMQLHVYIYIYMYFLYVYVHICMHPWIFLFQTYLVCVCVLLCVYVCIYQRKWVYVCTCVCACISTVKNNGIHFLRGLLGVWIDFASRTNGMWCRKWWSH